MSSTSPSNCATVVPDYCRAINVQDKRGKTKWLIFPKALDLDRPKRARTFFSQHQLQSLEDAFQQSPYLDATEREKLAIRLGLTPTQVKVWYQNRRTKAKKKQDESGKSSFSIVESETVPHSTALAWGPSINNDWFRNMHHLKTTPDPSALLSLQLNSFGSTRSAPANGSQHTTLRSHVTPRIQNSKNSEI